MFWSAGRKGDTDQNKCLACYRQAWREKGIPKPNLMWCVTTTLNQEKGNRTRAENLYSKECAITAECCDRSMSS
jgi:hypothetical protein